MTPKLVLLIEGGLKMKRGILRIKIGKPFDYLETLEIQNVVEVYLLIKEAKELKMATDTISLYCKIQIYTSLSTSMRVIKNA